MSLERQPVTHPAIACTQVQNAESTLRALCKGRHNGSLHYTESVCSYRPLVAIPPGDIFERQVQVIFRLRTAAPFGSTDQLILGNKPSEVINAIGRKRSPDAVFVLRCHCATLART